MRLKGNPDEFMGCFDIIIVYPLQESICLESGVLKIEVERLINV